MTDFETDRRHALAQVAAFFDTLLQLPDGPESRLIEAMRYTVLSEGKGFRPYLAYAAAQLFNVDEIAVFGSHEQIINVLVRRLDHR
ncbi:MAG: hypothetical protein ACPHDV_04170 [Parvibaculales bacterium]